MGDNRNASRDSRSLSVGTVKEEYIVGRVLFRFFPRLTALERSATPDGSTL